MKDLHSQYPDISEILARKASGRRLRGALSFVEKLAILDALKERIEPLVQARKARKERQVQAASRQV
jgi:hypothetical protein